MSEIPLHPNDVCEHGEDTWPCPLCDAKEIKSLRAENERLRAEVGRSQEARTMTGEEEWNKRRAVTALLEIARDALQAAGAVVSNGCEPTRLDDVIYEARKAAHAAMVLAGELPVSTTLTGSEES